MDDHEYRVAINHIVEGLIRKKKGNNSRGVFFFLGAGFSMRLPGEQEGVGSAKVIAQEMAEKVGLSGEDNLLRLSEFVEVAWGKPGVRLNYGHKEQRVRK
jgi:hypothetical protein